MTVTTAKAPKIKRSPEEKAERRVQRILAAARKKGLTKAEKPELTREQRVREKLEASRRAARERADAGVTDRVIWMVKAAQQAQDTANALRAKLDPQNPDKAARRAIKQHEGVARRNILAAQAMQREEIDKRWAASATDETLDQARRRGDEISRTYIEFHTAVVNDEGGADVKTTSARPAAIWAGPEHAFEKGYLDPLHARSPSAAQLLATARLYRDAYEISVGQTTTQGGGSGGKAAGPQLRILEAGDRLKIMRQALRPRMLKVLDLVCGQNLRLRFAATRMAAGFPATQRALRAGLQIAGANWEDAQKSGLVGRAVAEVSQASEMLERMLPNSVR